MSEPSAAQRYQLILADIALAAAVAAHGGALEAEDRADYAPGVLRDRWLARTPEGLPRRRITAMANAGVAALQQLTPERLQEMGERFGVPVGAALAGEMAQHFQAKREAWLNYNR